MAGTGAARECSSSKPISARDRLEKKGYVAYRMGEAVPERGGRARKYFRVLPEGRTALRATREVLQTMWEGVRL